MLTAQTDSVSELGIKVSLMGNPKMLISETFNSGVALTISPFRKWDRHKVVNTSVLVGTAALSYLFVDEALDEILKREISSEGRRVGRTISELGNPLLVGSAILGLDLLGHISDKNKLNQVAFLSAQSFAISMSFCYAAKHVSGRLRPNYTDNHDMWYGPNWNENPKRSFFSGHTTALFSVVSVVSMEYAHISWLPVALYSLAGTAALSRLTAGDHWASDVVFSAVFSHLVARSVVKRWKVKTKKSQATPVFSSNGMGLQWLF
jgi:hypothetical protein